MFNKIFISFMALLAMVMFAAIAEARSPVIIRHDAHLMEKDIKINLAWQSDEPVAKIIVTAGREQIIVETNIDNERNERGYSGEIDMVVPAYLYNATGEQSLYLSRQSSSQFQQSSMEMHANSASPNNEVVNYTVQLVDEVNQRSTLLKDKVRRVEPGNPKIVAREQSKPATALGAIDTKNPLNTALNTTIGLIGNIGQTPEVRNVKIKNWTENRVSINFDATGGKGIDRVVFEVRDLRGDIIAQNTVTCNAEKLCTKQTDPITLNAGKYVLFIMAIDAENNNSKKVEQSFQVQGVTNTMQQQPQTSQQQIIQQAPQQPSSVPMSTDDIPIIVNDRL